VDVLVLMGEPAFPGCLLRCRLIGIIEAEQEKKKKIERNDRIVAVEQANHSYARVKHIDDLGRKFVEELEEFFVNYHELTGKEYRILDVQGPGEAKRRTKDGMRALKKKGILIQPSDTEATHRVSVGEQSYPVRPLMTQLDCRALSECNRPQLVETAQLNRHTLKTHRLRRRRGQPVRFHEWNEL
jgi:hypothetical protein